jgi:hypothetical protein
MHFGIIKFNLQTCNLEMHKPIYLWCKTKMQQNINIMQKDDQNMKHKMSKTKQKHNRKLTKIKET